MASLLYLLAQLGILGVRHDWYGGGGFGPRFLIESLPVLAMGLAVLLDRLPPRHGVWLGGALLAVLGFHQLVLVTMVEQHWLPMQNYYQGQPIGFDVQLMGLIRVLREPGALLLPRPSVGGERQALLVSLVQGQRGLSLYGMPLVALAVSGLGLFAALLARTLFAPLLARTRWIAVGAALLACYMLGWCCFLLAL